MLLARLGRALLLTSPNFPCVYCSQCFNASSSYFVPLWLSSCVYLAYWTASEPVTFVGKAYGYNTLILLVWSGHVRETMTTTASLDEHARPNMGPTACGHGRPPSSDHSLPAGELNGFSPSMRTPMPFGFRSGQFSNSFLRWDVRSDFAVHDKISV